MHTPRHNTAQKQGSMTRFVLIGLAILCILTLLSPTVFARTYVITDGDRIVTYTTFATDPTEILSAAGVTLDSTDFYTTSDGNTITVQRDLEMTLVYHGTEMTVTFAEGESVQDLLNRRGLDVTREDTLSHPMDMPLFQGMTLRVDQIRTQQEIYAVTIPHDTTYCQDATLPEGTEAVLISGKNGQLVRTAQVTYRNGVEIKREVTQEKQTIAPITEIIGQGTAKPEFEQENGRMPDIRDGIIIMPSGEILSYYKTDNVTATGYTHTDAGCDMITSTGTTVRYGTVAVDPRFIPYGTKMLIVSHDGQRFYGIATAEDCGGAIKRDKMDLYFPTYEECIEFGRRRCTIYFLE